MIFSFSSFPTFSFGMPVTTLRKAGCGASLHFFLQRRLGTQNAPLKFAVWIDGASSPSLRSLGG